MWFLVPQTVAPKTHNCIDWLDVSIMLMFPFTGIKGPKRVQNMSDLHRALTSTPPHPNILTLHQYLTSLMLVWLNEHTSPYSHATKSNRKSSQKRESDYNIKRGQILSYKGTSTTRCDSQVSTSVYKSKSGLVWLAEVKSKIIFYTCTALINKPNI